MSPPRLHLPANSSSGRRGGVGIVGVVAGIAICCALPWLVAGGAIAAAATLFRGLPVPAAAAGALAGVAGLLLWRRRARGNREVGSD